MARASTLLFPLAETLLREGQAPHRAAVAHLLDIGRGALHPWFDHLEHHRAIRTLPNVVEVDRDRLLGVLTAHRVAGQRPATPFRTGLSVEEMSDLLDAEDVAHAFCMFTAANQWAFYEPRREVCLYVRSTDRRRVGELLEGSGDTTVRPFVEAVEHVPTQRRGDLTITSPLLTVVDLRAHPEGGAHAQFLQDHVLRRTWR